MEHREGVSAASPAEPGGLRAAAGPASLPWAVVTPTSPPWALREGDVDELPGLLSTRTHEPRGHLCPQVAKSLCPSASGRNEVVFGEVSKSHRV